MELYLFEYKISYWSDENQKSQSASGIVAGESIPEATSKLYERYGEENINVIQITGIKNSEYGMLEF